MFFTYNTLIFQKKVHLSHVVPWKAFLFRRFWSRTIVSRLRKTIPAVSCQRVQSLLLWGSILCGCEPPPSSGNSGSFFHPQPPPKGPDHTKNTTVIVIHYGGSKNTTAVVTHYGRISETPCFPGNMSQEISAKTWITTAIVNHYAVVFLVWPGPLGQGLPKLLRN